MVASIDGPKQKQRVIQKIPAEVIKNAKGLAIFTTMRSGLWISGAGGCGVLVGRLPDGSWSPPSGIMLHTLGLGFLVGVDIYDCVIVINTYEALNAFAKWRATLGGEISAVAGLLIDGTVIIERTDENERFYRHRISATDILAGKVRSPPFEIRGLMATLKAAQGDSDVDHSLLSDEPAPADFEVVESGHVFGIPDKEDPDPYGVLALEKAGLLIKEAGTNHIAAPEEFDFKPSMTSPIFNNHRKSFESSSQKSLSHRNSWRTSMMSTNTNIERRYVTMDMSTQTDDLPPPPAERSSSIGGLSNSPRESPRLAPRVAPVLPRVNYLHSCLLASSCNGRSRPKPTKQDSRSFEFS
ncbi:hypothetical protein MRB53_039804 [Persea americana]|nr:hypothetical protein MRB53_039804 [Persea americana]